MTLTRKINYKSHKKTRRQNGGGRFSDFIRSFFTKKPAPTPSGPPPSPPPPIPADIVRLFNAKMKWRIDPDSTYYEILNVPSDADDQAINKGFRAIGLRIHPDKLNAAEQVEYTPIFQEVGRIRDILLNPATRARYDALLRMYPKAPPPPSPPPSGSSSGHSSPPPPVGPPPGLNLSFMSTQIPNPLEGRRGQNPRPPGDVANCQIISDFTNVLGKPSTPKTLLPKSVFNIEENSDVDFEKLNEFLRKLGPVAAIKKSKKNKR
jgi:curved DNA-binding protein CbpA